LLLDLEFSGKAAAMILIVQRHPSMQRSLRSSDHDSGSENEFVGCFCFGEMGIRDTERQAKAKAKKEERERE
jgi:hypothetical protein